MTRFCCRSASQDRRVGILSLACFLLIACGDGGESEATNESATPSARAAQRRAGGGETSVTDATGAPGEVALTIEISAGADRAEVSGMGKCSHAKEGSIYGVPAALWQIQDSDAGEIRSASLTVWRPTTGDGPDQFSMAIGTATGQYLISTVKGGKVVGSGSVTMHPAGQGAHFEVVGTDADGRSLRATFQCARFTEHRAEGG
jgi:hypothetical protein